MAEKKEEGVNKLIVVLLVIAIVFSLASIFMDIYLSDLKPVSGKNYDGLGNSGGKVNLVVESGSNTEDGK